MEYITKIFFFRKYRIAQTTANQTPNHIDIYFFKLMTELQIIFNRTSLCPVVLGNYTLHKICKVSSREEKPPTLRSA